MHAWPAAANTWCQLKKGLVYLPGTFLNVAGVCDMYNVIKVEEKICI